MEPIGAEYGVGPHAIYRARGLKLGETDSVFAELDPLEAIVRRVNGAVLVTFAAVVGLALA
jgi:hypothetical protein